MHVDTESVDSRVLKKKAKKRKREAQQREVGDAHEDSAGDESHDPTNHVVPEKTCKPSTGTDGSFAYRSLKHDAAAFPRLPKFRNTKCLKRNSDF